MAFNLADLIEHSVDLVGDRTAVVVGDRRVTYKELDERANRLAHHLAANGVTKDSTVGIYSHNSIEFVETMFAAFKLRAVPINVNYRYVAEELEYLFDNADLVALVHQRQFAPVVAQVLPRSPLLKHVVVIEDGSDVPYEGVEYEAALAEQSPERDFEPRSDDDIYMLYTGGTTGMPKGVVYRHEDVWRVLGGGIDFQSGVAITDEWQQSRTGAEAPAAGVSFPIAPLMHGAGQWGTFNALFGGNTVVLIPKFDPHEVWKLVQREKVNTIAVTGDAMARPMVEALREGSYDTSSVVAFSSTAAVFSPSIKDEYLELLPNCFLTEAIGATETGFSGLTMHQKGQKARGGGPTVNIGPETIVIDDDGTPIEPGSGKIGRIARSGHVPLRYHKDPEKSAATFITINGVRYSIPGDFARVEEDGSVTLLGRGSNCINSGGEKIFPEEVEGALKSHPDVFDAIVVGVPDERFGSRVAAVVQAREGREPTLEQLDQHVRTKIAGYKVPRELFLVDEVKRQPSGKPDYPWAQEYALKNR
ncbi:MAG TPA: acyl-CoA synthetase [Actinomycetota bacterium]|nr:acyl-CoA synthetase [Actinomycetota bacterium]